MAKTKAQANREIRQEALRDQLAAKGLVQKVLDNLEKIDELQVIEGDRASIEHATFRIQQLKASNEQRLKLINKYLPDMKAVEHSGQVDSTVSIVDQIKAAHAARQTEQQ